MLLFLSVLAAVAGAAPDTLVIPVGEVVVTGSRVAEPLARTPAAITVVPRAAFESSRAISLRDAMSPRYSSTASMASTSSRACRAA